jgi:hypothetical protein
MVSATNVPDFLVGYSFSGNFFSYADKAIFIANQLKRINAGQIKY